MAPSDPPAVDPADPALAAPGTARITLEENRSCQGEVPGPAVFETDSIVSCSVGLFLTHGDDGPRTYCFSHRPETCEVLDDTFGTFLESARGRRVRGVIFAPTAAVARLEPRVGPAFASLLGGPVAWLPYAFPDGLAAYTFTARLDGRELAVEASNGYNVVRRAIPLEDSRPGEREPAP
jgi:hypothetical protein